MCKTLSEAVAAAGAGSGGQRGAAKSQNQQEVEELKAENKKLSYRVTHLLRALDELDK